MNWIAFSLALLGHLLFQTHALAQESTTLGIHAFSYHNSGNYNDITPGLYLERNHFVIGAYYVCVRATHIESVAVQGDDGVHQELKWTPWNTPNYRPGVVTATS